MSKSRPTAESAPEVPWLSSEQQRIWRTYLLGVARINVHLEADLRPYGLDLAEYEILVCLEEVEGRRLRMSELADLVHQSRSRLSHTITRMERSGLVRRQTCPEDRRGVWAHLTDEGFALLTAAAPSHVRAVREIFVEAVTPKDYEAVGRAFSAVLTADKAKDQASN